MKRYLVYKSWNGQIHCSIEYGEQYTGDGKKKDDSEIKRFDITSNVSDRLNILKLLYPLEEIKDEASINH